ncbi:MAG: RDD family protein [Blastocatellia bacterium]
MNYLQPITPPPRTRFAVAAELTTAEPQLESPVIATPPAHRHAEAAVALAAPKAVPVLESFAEPELAVTETPEDPLAEVLTIPTPKQDEPGPAQGLSILEAASLAKRAAAAVIDAEIIAFSLLPLFAVYFFLGGWVETSAIYVPIAVGAVLVALYFFVTYALAGRTMGMAFMNLHLASQSATTENTPPAGPTTVTFTFQQAALRALGGTLSLLLFPINFICIARSYDRLSLSDLLSGTQVVKIKK